jgi:hypothetical protein
VKIRGALTEGAPTYFSKAGSTLYIFSHMKNYRNVNWFFHLEILVHEEHIMGGWVSGKKLFEMNK